MADETSTDALPPGFTTGATCSVDLAAKTIKLGFAEERVEKGAVDIPVDAASQVAFYALRAAQAIAQATGAGAGTPKPTPLLSPNSAAVTETSQTGRIGLMFQFGDATFGVELNVEAAQQLAQGLITASVRARPS